MARVNGMKPMFKMAGIREIFENFQEEVDDKTLTTLQYLGEEFVNRSRMNDTYKDRTGNLRSSIGYIILKDGNVVDRNFEGKSKGKSKGQSFADEVANDYPKGYVLIGVAGMKYAAYVEAKNYDVITGSAPTVQMIKYILNEIKP